jgi:hypothetical protein
VHPILAAVPALPPSERIKVRAESDDPLAPFSGKPIYFDQRTGTDAVYRIRSGRPVTRVHWMGATMTPMRIEVLDLGGKIAAEKGPLGGGNPWAEFTLDFPRAAGSSCASATTSAPGT